MSNPIYDINAEWHDPFESRQERRATPRVQADLRTQMTVRSTERRGRFVGPAVTEDISLNGMRAVTKHDVMPGEVVKIRIQTDDVQAPEVFADRFEADCRVLRVQAIGRRHKRVALSFPDSLTNDVEFALFVRALETRPETQLAS